MTGRVTGIAARGRGEGTEKVCREVPLRTVAHLACNESPYAPPESVRARLARTMASANRYPLDGEEAVFLKIGKRFGIPVENLMLTRGIDEAVDRLGEEFGGMRFVVVRPGFDGYASRLGIHGRPCQVLELDESFQIRRADLAQIAKNHFVFLANPNNPTGCLFEEEAIAELARRSGWLLVDETYVDFSRHADQLCRRPGNMFVFRSFSKAYALAGLRAGFLAGAADRIASMRRRQWFCNMDSFSLAALSGAIESDYSREYAGRILGERSRVIGRARAMGYRVLPSVTNFFLLADESGEVARHLFREGISVRETGRYGLPGHLRISVGSPEENDALLGALSRLGAGMTVGARQDEAWGG